MRELRIAIVVGTFPTVSETFIVNQINSLIEAGHEVQIFAYKRGEIQHIHSSIKKYDLLKNVIYFQKKDKSKPKRFLVFLNWVFKNLKHIRWNEFLKALNVFEHGKRALALDVFFDSKWFLSGRSFDIIHVHFGHNTERIAVLKSLGFIRESKLIGTFHGFDLIPNNVINYNERYKNLLTECDAFTVNSIYLANILEKLNVKLVDIYLLPVGLDTAYFNKTYTNDSKGSFEMLFCGRLIKLKGPDIALDILIELKNRGYKNVKLRLVGDGDLRDEIVDKIERGRLSNDVFMEGALAQEFVKEKMSNAQVFLMPGTHDPITKRAETQGLVLQEAQAMKLPVVISDVGGMKYGIIPNETGYIIKEGDISGFADAVEKLINDDQLRSIMGEKGREYVEANFDNKVLYNKLIDIYTSVLDR